MPRPLLRAALSCTLVLAAALGALLAAPLAAGAATTSTIVSVEFDDGAVDQYAARQMLSDHGMHGVFFINSGRIGTSGYLSLAQIQGLAADGNEIGGHTVSHADLPTVSTGEQQRQICNDRVALLNLGFDVRSLAYPYGDFDAGVENVARGCGYNSARTIGGIVSPGTCTGCGTAETLPPLDLYALRTPDSAKIDTSLATLEGYVTQAEQHGGGWVRVVFHHLCDGSGCDTYSVPSATFDAFLDWLGARQSRGTIVRTVAEVVGGARQPGVSAPAAPPAGTTANLLANPSMETATTSSTPDCWLLGGFGANAAAWSRVQDAHSGLWGERLQVTSFTDGDRKLVSKQDLGACAPPVTASRTYRVAAWYKSTTPVRLVVYTRNASGGWDWWAQSPSTFPAASAWTEASWLSPAIPAGVGALSAGLSVRATGTATFDDFSVADTDQTPPTVTLTAPADGARVKGTTQLTATAADASGIDRVEFLAKGRVVGTDRSAPYTLAWDTTAQADDTVSLSARAYDVAGNVTTATSHMVTVVNGDQTAPVTTISCDGSPCTGAWRTAPALVTLAATDDRAGVDVIRYTTDGTVPTADSPAYTQPFTVSRRRSVRFRAWDLAGNVEAMHDQELLVDAAAPASSAACAPGPCGVWSTGPVDVTLTGADTGDSGLAAVRYTTDGTDPKPASPAAMGPIHLTRTTDLRWRAYDVAGNAEPVQALVERIDPTPPSSSADCAGPCPAGWSTHPVTVTLSADDADSGVAAIRYTTDGSAPAPGSAEAIAPLLLTSSTTLRWRAYDVAGNAEAVHALVLRIDTSAPTAALTAPATGAVLTGAPVVEATADDDQGVERVDFLADGRVVGSDATAPYALVWDTTAVDDGPVELVARARDGAGNVTSSAPVAAQVANASNADVTPPETAASCAGTPCDTWSADPATLTLTASDAGGSGIRATRYTTDGSMPTLDSALYAEPLVLHEPTTVTFRSWDAAGNAEEAQTVTVDVDGRAPHTTAACDGDACPAWSRGPVELALEADDADSGVAAIRYTLDGTEPDASSSAYSAPLDVRATTTVRFRAYDAVGNAEPVRDLLVRIDAAAPSSTASCDGGACTASWSPAPAHMTLGATDDGSGVDAVRYTLDGTAPDADSPAADGPLTITAPTTVRFRAYDVAGNAEAPQAIDLRVDGDAPATAAACAGGSCDRWFAGPVAVTLTATDGGGSGVAAVRYTLDGSAPNAGSPAATGSVTVASTATLRFRAYDAVGNAESVRSQAVSIDTQPPSAAITCNDAACPSTPLPGPVTIKLTSGDQGGSGVDAVRYTLDGSAPTPSSPAYAGPLSLTQPTTVRYRAYDRAGNAGAAAAQAVDVVFVAGNLLKNPSLEADADGDGFPDCWMQGQVGGNAGSWARTATAHAGAFAELVSATSYADGNRKVVSKQDAGACAPAGTAGHAYRITGWYKGTGQSRLVVYYRAGGVWTWWAQGPLLPATSTWTPTSYVTPALPAGATLLSAGLSLQSAGTMYADDLAITDAG